MGCDGKLISEPSSNESIASNITKKMELLFDEVESTIPSNVIKNDSDVSVPDKIFQGELSEKDCLASLIKTTKDLRTNITKCKNHRKELNRVFENMAKKKDDKHCKIC